MPPECIYAIFTHPDNSCLFRDVKCVGTRNVLKAEPDYKLVSLCVLYICLDASSHLSVLMGVSL